MNTFKPVTFFAAALAAALSLALPAGEPPSGGEGGKGDAAAGQGNAPPPTEREKKILDLFTATRKSFREGKIVLEYDFKTRNDDLLTDWKPTMQETKKRIRWPNAYEGTYTTTEEGVIVADFGEFIHKAVFLNDLEVKVELINVSPQTGGTFLGPTYYSEKKRRAIGVNGGTQFIGVSGWKLASAPFPRQAQTLPSNVRTLVGYKLKGKLMEANFKGKKVADTSSAPGFTQGFEAGHVGLAWNGRVQCFIMSVTMEGRLDPDWVGPQIGEKEEKGSEKKASGDEKKSGGKKAASGKS